LHAVIIPLDENLFNKFQNLANKKNMKLEEAGNLAIQEWVIKEGG